MIGCEGGAYIGSAECERIGCGVRGAMQSIGPFPGLERESASPCFSFVMLEGARLANQIPIIDFTSAWQANLSSKVVTSPRTYHMCIEET